MDKDRPHLTGLWGELKDKTCAKRQTYGKHSKQLAIVCDVILLVFLVPFIIHSR